MELTISNRKSRKNRQAKHKKKNDHKKQVDHRKTGNDTSREAGKAGSEEKQKSHEKIHGML